MIDFDKIDDWLPELERVLARSVSSGTLSAMRCAKPEYVEDAMSALFELAGRDTVIDATLAWLRSSTIAGYHGTRLTDQEVSRIRSEGLLPLDAARRRVRLVRALSVHPNWIDDTGNRIDAVLEEYGPKGWAGNREGQAHLTLSRAGLVHGFNHYLTHGSEFDQHAARALLGDEGVASLAHDGKGRLIQFAVPGQQALSASHPYFSIEDLRSRGDVPNIAREFLKAGSYKLAYPDFDPQSLEVDCGMVFRSAVPAAWIRSIETIEDQG